MLEALLFAPLRTFLDAADGTTTTEDFVDALVGDEILDFGFDRQLTDLGPDYSIDFTLVSATDLTEQPARWHRPAREGLDEVADLLLVVLDASNPDAQFQLDVVREVLHDIGARDNERLLKTLTYLRDLGNTVIVVEHDEEAIEKAYRAYFRYKDLNPYNGLN